MNYQACKKSLLCLALGAIGLLSGCASLNDMRTAVLPPKCSDQYEVRATATTINFPLGHSWKTCGGYQLDFQSDGNLVLYNAARAPLWNSGTAQKGANRLAMQSDGNLVIYAGNTPLWSSGTAGNPSAALRVQSDGNVVLYNAAGAPIWQTATVGR